MRVESLEFKDHYPNQFNDYSFLTAPAYKAFEGYLFQIAKEMKLPSSSPKLIGTYFDEGRVDETIDNLLKELEAKSEGTAKLSKDEKQFIKDMVSEMKRFLFHYRHTPAHYIGDLIDTADKAEQNIHSIYRIINETTKTLLKAKLISPSDDVH